MNISLARMGEMLKSQEKNADRSYYGVVKQKITEIIDGEERVTGYKVSLGANTETVDCRRLAGANIGDVVLVLLMTNGSMVVTGRKDGDAEAQEARSLAVAASEDVEQMQEAVEEVQEDVDTISDLIINGELTVAYVRTEYCLSTSNSTFIPYEDMAWSEDLPAYVANTFYWTRTATHYDDGETVKYSEPRFSLAEQLTAETAAAQASTNNHFWYNNSGVYISEQDGDAEHGYATRLTNAGILQTYDDKLMSAWTNSGTTYYKSNGVDPLAWFGGAGVGFADDVPFTIGNSNQYIKWVQENGTWKVKIAADVIEMGGSSVLVDGDAGMWYSGTGITGTSQTETVFPNSGVSDAKIGDMYLNTSSGNTYRCTVRGIPAVAKWVFVSNIKGEDGADGADGTDGTDGTSVWITSTSVKYQSSYSGTTIPTGTWSTSIPYVYEGYYLWTRTEVEYSDGHKTTSYSTAYQGYDGTDITSQYLWFSSSGDYAGLNIKYSNWNNRVNLNSNGLYVYDGSSNLVATFGSTATIGKTGSSDHNLYVESSTIKVRKGTSWIGGLGSTTTSSEAIFSIVSNGCPIIIGTGSASKPINLMGYTVLSDARTSTSSSNVHFRTGTGGAGTGELMQVTSSSRRYKTDISDIGSQELDPNKLYDLRVAQFRFKDGYLDSEDQRFGKLVPGFVAEEVAEVYPIAADTRAGLAENWSERMIIPPMLKLIQDHKKKLDELELEIKTLKGAA